MNKLDITVIIATKDEELNLKKCLESVSFCKRIVVVDSNSKDSTVDIARQYSADVYNFDYRGGYPKKRQWAMDNVAIDTNWIFMLDADEVVTKDLQREIETKLKSKDCDDAYFVRKKFHFLGKRFSFGGFSFKAVLLFRKNYAKYEELLSNDPSGLDMEVHERVVVSGKIGSMTHDLVHDDFKGLSSYIEKHNKYSDWEARVRLELKESTTNVHSQLKPNIFGNAQERRRALKILVMRLPFEHVIWFLFHYIFCLGIFEGRLGYYACVLRANYIQQVRLKEYEIRKKN